MVKKISKKKIKYIIDKIKKEVEKEYPISDVFIFGSYATNRANSNSDLDICFVSSKFKDRSSASIYLNEKIYELGLFKKASIDAVGYPAEDFNINSPLVWEIKRTAIAF